jgi:S1-C subfamily serine protease
MRVRSSALTAAAALACSSLASAGPAAAQQRPAPSAARRTPMVAAVERAKSAVVNISAQEIVRARQPNDPFELFLGGGRARDEVRTSLGSGFVFDASGFVLTNYHVVANGSRIQVSFDDGSDYLAKVVGTDPGGDLAVLKIEGTKPFPAAPLGVSVDLMLGEPAIAIGNPFGLNQSVSVGVVSALHRTVPAEGRSYYDFIQTDASINPGNSGGPLLNADGAVIGVCSAIYANAQGIGFAIPIDRALRVARELVRSGEIGGAFWGFEAEPIGGPGQNDAQGRLPGRSEGLPKNGALVTSIDDGSPAAKAGLKEGDAIVRLDASPVRDADELRFLLRDVPPATPITLGVLRAKAPLELKIASQPLTPEQAQTLFENRTGLAISELTPAQARELGYETRGKVIGIKFVEKNSAAARAGLRRGDLIRAVNSAEVETLADLRKALAQARKQGRGVLLVQRGYRTQEISFDAG